MRNGSRIAATATAALTTLLATGIGAKAAEIHLMTTGAVEYIMRDLIPPFERLSGHKVTMTVLGTGGAVTRIKEGTFADLILLGPDALNELARAGKVDVIGDLPAELNKTIIYATGLTTMVKQAEAANALVNHLSLQSSAPAIRKNGMEPVGN